MFGVTTLITTCLALYLRVNLPLALFTTYAVGPIHLLLFIPFIRVGEFVLGADHTLLTFQAIKEAFRSNYLTALGDLSLELVCGLTGWSILALPAAMTLYIILSTLFIVIKRVKK